MDDLPKHFHMLLLTQVNCGFCEQAQEILERLAREYWLSVSTFDVGSPEGQRLAVQGGLLFPPGVLIDGEPFSYGRLSERKLRRELDRRMGFVDRPPVCSAIPQVSLSQASAKGDTVRVEDRKKRTGEATTIPRKQWS